MERMLKVFMSEIRSGRRESAALPIVSSCSLTESEKGEWRQLRKELQSVGITPEVFSLNRDFILTTLRSLSQTESGDIFNIPTIDEGGTVGWLRQPSPRDPHRPMVPERRAPVVSG